MARRKKKVNYNFILIGLGLVVVAWIAADYYFNVYQHPQEEKAAVAETKPAPVVKNELPVAQEAAAETQDSAFKNETYRGNGFEFQYPVAVKDASLCPKFEKMEGGFYLGIFSFSASSLQGNVTDYINEALRGMAIDSRQELTVGGRPATKVDYQTTGMGWYGSSTFVENNEQILEFGLLANESSDKCGGVDNYEDLIYQSVRSTLKFNN